MKPVSETDSRDKPRHAKDPRPFYVTRGTASCVKIFYKIASNHHKHTYTLNLGLKSRLAPIPAIHNPTKLLYLLSRSPSVPASSVELGKAKTVFYKLVYAFLFRSLFVDKI